ncbi:MAG: ABC transporter substrate-binding protein [Myxococcota bacterium]
MSLLLLLGTGCQPGVCTPDAPEAEPPAPTLVIGTTSEPSSLDPLRLVRFGEREVLQLMRRELLQFDSAWRRVPDAALQVPTATRTQSGLRVDWTLRERRWSDGRPLSTVDILTAWRREREDPEAPNHEVARSVQLEAIDGRRFVALWSEARSDVTAPRVHTIYPAEVNEDGGPFDGPFTLAQWRPGVAMELVPNPHWPGPGPHLPRIVVRFFPGEEALATAVATGQVDVVLEGTSLSAARLAQLAKAKGEGLVELAPGSVMLHLDPRHDHPALGRTQVRRLLSQSLDRKTLVDLAYDGAAQMAEGLFPPSHRGYGTSAPPPSVPPEATALEVVWTGSKQLRLQFASGSPAAEAVASYIQQRFGELGLQVALEALPLSVLFQRMREGTQGELTLFAWRIRPDWDGRSILHGEGRQNWIRFQDDALDGALDALRGELDPEAWEAAAQRVDGRFRTLIPIIPLVFRQVASLRPRGLGPWRPTGTTTPVTWNAEHWRWNMDEGAASP